MDSPGSALTEELLQWVKSNNYPCPGGHHSRRLTADEQEMDMGHLCWRESTVFYKEGRLPEGVYYKAEGQCAGFITIDLEWETIDEYRGFSYPVASGECAEALGIGEDDADALLSHPIIEAFQERRRIKALLEGKMTRATFQAERLEREKQSAKLREIAEK